MNKLLLLLSVFSSLLLNAQTIITADDMPLAGTSEDFIIGNTFTFLDFQSSEENFNWDFADLQEFTVTSEEYVPVEQTPFLYQFLFNSPFNEEYQASYALGEDGLDLEGLSFTDVYNYYKVTDDQFSAIGQGLTFNGIPLPSQLSPVDVIYEFPMQYGNTHESYSEAFFVFPTLMIYKLKQDRVTEADGWGTLTLPSGSIDCLRVKHSLNITDSLVFPQAEIDFEIPRPEEIVYQWLAADYGAPILEVRQVFGLNTSIRYQVLEEASSVDEENSLTLEIRPNPSTDFIQTNLSRNCPYWILDSNGRMVTDGKLNAGYVSTSSLHAGNYFLKVQLEKQILTKQFSVH